VVIDVSGIVARGAKKVAGRKVEISNSKHIVLKSITDLINQSINQSID